MISHFQDSPCWKGKPFRPMLAAKVDDFHKIKYPVFATPKIDGIRCMTRVGEDGHVEAVSRSLKPIRNKYIQEYLRNFGVSNLDGELVVGKNFQESTSGIMSEHGEPDFTFFVFDIVKNSPYIDRCCDLIDSISSGRVRISGSGNKVRVEPLLPLVFESPLELTNYEETMLSKGFEGVMIRSGSSPYKFGRSTFKEGYLLKLKRFLDDEALLVGFEPLFTNNNVIEINNLGLAERSTHKENKEEQATLGALKCKTTEGVEFNIGTGFTDDQRLDIWSRRDELFGKLVKFKYQPHGVKNAPRCPVFLGFRDSDDTESFQQLNQGELF